MKDIGEFFGLLALGIAAIVLVLLLVSTPFAFLGFILLAAANVFSASVTITYFGSFVVGFVAAILIGLISN